ncbi:hypothetical protein [Pyrobaculum aerophilum]|uniref:hypothetical protein n=1 Tax=Pyrobaculum aerophilum TaxID=13773 RepID=UPI0021635185|nr:hypothetical protein [Pyrobaculum aerophilum]
MIYKVKITSLAAASLAVIALLAALSHAATPGEFRGPIVELEEICIKAGALGLAGRSVHEVAFLSWLGDGFIPLPYRVEAVEISVAPLLINRTDAEKYAFKSHTLPPRFENDTTVCISIPKKTARPPPRAPRGGDLYQIGDAYVVVSPRQPYDPPPVPVAGSKRDSVPVRKAGVVEAVGAGAEPLSAVSAAVKTISGGFKTIAASNTTVAANGVTFTVTPIDLPNGTKYIWLAFTNVTQPGSYSLYYKVYDAASNAVYFEGTVTAAVDGRSPYYFVISIPVYQKAYNNLLKLYIAIKNNNPVPRAVDLVIVGIFDTSRHMDNRWVAGMATTNTYGFPEYVVPIRDGYAAIPVHIPPGGVHGTEKVRVRLGLRICSSNAPSSLTVDVYLRPIWVGSLTFTYSYRDSWGCAVYNTAQGTYTGFLPLPYLLLGTTDLAIGPLPAGARVTVYELYVEGYRRPEFNRPWSPAIYDSTWLDGTFVINSVLKAETYIYTNLRTGQFTEILIRLALSPIVTPSGVVPLSPGEYIIHYYIYATGLSQPDKSDAVEGRQETLVDKLLPIVRRINAILSALGFVIDRTVQDAPKKVAYKVVTFAGRVTEQALSSAKTKVEVYPNYVWINVGWEETKNAVIVSIRYSMIARSDLKTDIGWFKSPYTTISNDLFASSNAYSIGFIQGVDIYRTWYCLYQDISPGTVCDASTYR